MNQTNYFKIFAFVAFVVLMAISCWASVQSLHLRLPNWPIVFFGAISVVFFVVSSIGVKLIVDSFSQHLRIDNRGWRLTGGIILLLVFWVFFSIPTNTHTFFYRSAIRGILTQELTDTRMELENLADITIATNIINAERIAFETAVRGTFTQLVAEVNCPINPGVGIRAEYLIGALEGKLGRIQRPPHPENTIDGRRRFIDAMRTQVEALLHLAVEERYNARIERIRRGLNQDEIAGFINEIRYVQNRMRNREENHILEPTIGTRDMLIDAFTLIRQYRDFMGGEIGRQHIVDDERFPERPRTARVRYIETVWLDYFAGELGGRGFFFWILLGALVDIAGFIFFYITFRRTDY